MPLGLTNQLNEPCSEFILDQSPTNALATGDSQTFLVTVTNDAAQTQPLRFTLAWTDPPGDPAAAIKLVNNLDLVVTNLDDPANPLVFYGNDIGEGSIFNTPNGTNLTASIDSINNVENVFIAQPLGTNYSVTVIGRAVNVNAVTAQTNNVVQDYALVISCGDGAVTNAFTVTTNGTSFVSNPTGDQRITYIVTTNTPLLNQIVGANPPLLGTNTMPLGPDTTWSTNGQMTFGMTNQWHFYVVTNNALDNAGLSSNVTNAAFITFLPNTLSTPRMGVFADSTFDATRPEADIDLYVSSDSNLLTLDPLTLSNCLNGAQIGLSVGTPPVFNAASLGAGGTEFVVDTNSTPGQVYYVGVHSEDRMAAEYNFLSVFTATPFSQMQNGNQLVNGIALPIAIPDGSPAHPGIAYIFGLALYPMQAGRVLVSDAIVHQNYGDLIGTLNHNGIRDVLNNHDSFGSPPGPYSFVYDDFPSLTGHLSDGPGSLLDFVGTEAIGPWMLTEVDNSPTQIGYVSNYNLTITPHKDLTHGVTVTIQPGGWFYDFVEVPVGYRALLLSATNITTPPYGLQPVQMFEKFGSPPTATVFDQEADLTNCFTGTFPTGSFPGNSISTGPPLPPGFYYVGIYNPLANAAQDVYIIAQLIPEPVIARFVTNGPAMAIPDDAVTQSSVFIGSTQKIASVDVSLIVTNARISDLSFTLVSPTGQRILLMENRGGTTAESLGHANVITNFFGAFTAGGAAASTNILGPVGTSGTLLINYDFFTVPDTMDVYYQDLTTPIFRSGPVSGSGRFSISYGPGFATNLVIVMNQGNNTNATTQWIYTPSVVSLGYTYVTFTTDTNRTQIPIKFAIPPYDLGDTGTNYTLSDFELATNGDYFAFTNIYDAQGGWTLPTNLVTLSTVITNASLLVTNVLVLTNNEVSLVTDPATAQTGSNYLALANGVMTRTIPVTAGRLYSVSFAYRGPGIAAWARGEGNATDSSDPENFGNNGSLIGRFDFPAGEVGQAFQMEAVGQPYGFAGTNTYVQIRQQPSYVLANTNGGSDTNLVLIQTTALDVGTGSGFTVEGWINPTNVSGAEPLVEWLARVPTNGADTNLVIEAGPFLDRETGHYYYLLGSTNWTTSELWATQMGGHLVTLDTANEQNWVYDTFAQYGGVNRNLWIGLTNYTANPTNFAWSSGLTNVTYFNWAPGEPTNCSGNDFYTAILGPTNAYPGLWVLESNSGTNNNGVDCDVPPSNHIYGVVEVNDLQTNGVQLWISVTNSPGTTNVLVSSNGCLYANLVDITNGSHEIFSAPGLIQSNLYQHIALTYNTNTGVAALFYNGTNVASTNLGVFVPRTTGDVLLGKDMSRLTNNFYTGKMDEISIYRRCLSDAEITAIYNISALATNRNLGKFDPTVTPSLSLAKAQVSLSTVGTNLVYGENTNWLMQGFTFTPTTNSLELQIAGLEPGLLLDSFGVSIASQGNLYYLPETSLEALDGDMAFGTWTLEIWDNRTGGLVSNAQLVTWQLQFIMQTNVPITLSGNTSVQNTVPPGGITFYAVNVPVWATAATNILISATQPVDLLFNQTTSPTGFNPGDFILLANSTGGSYLMTTNPVPPPQPQLLPGQTYYLGVRNQGTVASTVVVEVDFNIPALTNGVPVTDVLTTNFTDVERYYTFDVTSNATEATFQLLQLNGNVDLVVRKGTSLPTLTSSDYGSFNVSNVDENIYVLTNSSPVPLSAGRWTLGVFPRDPRPIQYAILAKELDPQLSPPVPTVIELTNEVPFTFTAGPGAALTNFFKFTVTNTITASVTNLVGAIHFELYYLSGDGDLTVATNTLPLAPPFFQSSQQPGLTPEVIFVHTNSALTNLAADWYLGVPNQETNIISFTILAGIETNAVFPAFPNNQNGQGAQGAGAGSLGGRGGDVYHVVNLNDDGPGSLRYGITSFLGTGGTNTPGTGTTNITGSVSNFFGARTIVFDVSGTINLLSPLVITNSYLTIAGQSAQCGGITVAGQMTTLQSAHDVIIRDMRFRPTVVTSVTVLSDGFENYADQEGITPPSYIDGWRVVSGDVDVFNPSVGHLATADTGTNVLDLNGFGSGSISTNFATVPGQLYLLSFAYTKNASPANPGYPFFVASANIFITGQPAITLSTPAGMSNNYDYYDWQHTSYVFTATGPITTLQFSSLNSGSGGMLLDSITVTTSAMNVNPGDSLEFTNVANVIADHVSAEWSPDNLVSVLNSSNVTVQWSILADSLFTNAYPKLPLQGVGSLLRYGGGALSFHHNLYADNYSGNPYLHDNLSLDFVNNVIYNWGIRSGFTGTNDPLADPGGLTNQLNYVGNYLIAGPDTAYYSTNAAQTNYAFYGGITNTWIFQTNNFIDSDTNGILNGANTDWDMFTNYFTEFGRSFPLPPVAVDETFVAYEKVLDFAGVNLCKRDPVDVDIVTRVRTQTGRLITAPPSSGLVGWWKAEGNALDSISGATGIVYPGTTYSAGEVGQAFSFDGITGCVMNTNTPAYTNIQNTFTMEFWAYPQKGFDIMPEGGGNGITGQSYAIFPDWGGLNSGGPAGTGVCVGTNGISVVEHCNNYMPSSLSYTNPINGWTHIAVVYLNKQPTLYVNGVKVRTGVTSPETFVYPSKNLGNSYISVLGFAFFNTYGPYAGLLDEVKIHNRALSGAEIQAIYDAGIAAKFGSAAFLPYLDTDRDGIPDFWETTFGQNPTNASNNQLSTNVNYLGYSDLEEYLGWLAGPHALTVTNTPVGVDLYQLSGNSGLLSFSVTNAVNGTVYLTNVLGSVTNTGPFSNSIAFFTPATNFSGYASFDYFVTNNDTHAYFGPVTVSVVVSAVPVVFAAVNTNAPVLATNLPDQTLDELTTLTVTNTATDPNTNLTLTYTVTMSIDTNAMTLLGWPLNYATTTPAPVIDANGIITWTPSESQGPGVYIITTVVSDNGIPPLSDTNSFTVTVNEVNTAPFWPPGVPSQTNYDIGAMTTLIVTNTATDSDIPPNPLTYQLIGPPGAAIDTNGIITWTPTPAQAPGVYTFTTIVTDTNAYALVNQSLSATNVFTVSVFITGAPFVFTQPAQAVTGNSAQLNGMATPNGLPTTAWFDWGTNTLYGNQTPPVGVGAGFNVVYTTNLISGLTLNVPYHYRLVASNSVGIVYGFDQILDEANVVVWGADYARQAEVPAGLSNVVAIAGAYDHSIALKNNETAVGWGDNTFGQGTVPAGLNNNLLAIAGGAYYSIALKNNGTVASWGANILGQTNVPAGLNNVVEIAGGTYSSLALQNNGNVVAWGASFFNLTNVPAGLNNVVAIAGGSYHSLAIRNDGTVVAWGDDSANQTNVPAGLTNVVAIAGGGYHSLALKYDGTVVAWGDDSAGQTDVPAGLSNVVAVAAGGFHSLALKNDGTVVAWGDNTAGQRSVPVGLTNMVAVASGYLHSLALTPQSIASLTNIVLNLTNGVPQTNSVLPGGIVYYRVNVPTNADFATNSLLFALQGPLNVWFDTNTPPTTNVFLFGGTNGSNTLSTNGTPPLEPGTTYYLGVQNTNSFVVGYGIEVDFHLLITPTPPIFISTITYTNVGGNFGFLLTWYAPTNDEFLVQWTGGLPPPPTWTAFSNIVTYTSLTPTNGIGFFEYFDDGTQFPFGPVRFYRLQLLQSLTGGVPLTNSVPAGGIDYFLINVPTNADFATNRLLTADGPLNVWFSPTNLPVGANPPDYLLLGGVTNGLSILNTTGAPTNIVPGGTYWLGVQNTNSVAVTFSIQVDFHLLASTNAPTSPIVISGIMATNLGGNFGFLLTWYAPTNDEFLVQWTGGLPPPPTWSAFSNIVTYTSLTTTNGIGFFEYFDDGTQFPLGPVRFYRLMQFQALAGGAPLTNSVPANGIDYFLINVPANADSATNLLLSATGPLNLLFNQSAPPTGTNAGDYTLLAGVTNGGTTLNTTGVPTNIVPGGTYWLSVQNTNSVAVTFSIGVNFHLTAATVSISSITFTNLGGLDGFLLQWFAPTSDVYQVQWTDALSPANWQFYTNFIYYTGPATPTNGLFFFFDDGTQTPPGLPPVRLYRIVRVGSNPSTHTNAVSFSSVTSTNITGTNMLWLAWSAPTNYLFEMQWTTNLMPVVTWHTSPNIMAYSTLVSPTNSLFNYFDQGPPGGLDTIKFYRLILLP